MKIIMLCIFGYLSIGGITLLFLVKNAVENKSYSSDDTAWYWLSALFWPIVFIILIPRICNRIINTIAAAFEKEIKEKKK